MYLVQWSNDYLYSINNTIIVIIIIIEETKAILLPATWCRFEQAAPCACADPDSTNNMAKRRGDWSCWAENHSHKRRQSSKQTHDTINKPRNNRLLSSNNMKSRDLFRLGR